MTRFLVILSVGLSLLAAPGTAWAKWTRFSSPHFVFVGDAGERDMRDIAAHLEQFRWVASRVLSDEAATSPVPNVVIVFQDDRSFTPFKPVFQGRPVAVAGYFTPGEDVNYIAVNAEQGGSAYAVIFHEYTHFLLRNAVGDAPVWINEGLAEFYQTFQASSGGRRATLGAANLEYLRLLQGTATWLPIAQLVSVDHDSPLYNEGDRRTLFYAESWALTHYLTFAKSRVGQLRTYLQAIAQGAPAGDAFDRAFGADHEALERELRAYVRSVSLSAFAVTFDEAQASGTMSPAEVVPEYEAAGYLGDMMARLNRVDDARTYLRKTLEAKGDAARAMSALGLLELRAADTDAAFPLLEKAASLGPGIAAVQAAYGRALTMRADRGGADDEELYARARTVLNHALELEPDNISTLVTLAEVEMGSGANPSRAVEMMQRALAAAPGREEYRLMMAQALAVSGDYRGATNYLGVLMARGSRPAIRDAARSAMTRVAAAQNAARTLAASADPAEPLPPRPADREPPRETAVPGGFIPTLRIVQAGETRVLGTFAAVDCKPGSILLDIETPDGAVRLAVKDLNEIEFLTYRTDTPASIACGPQRPAFRVLATYRAGRSTAGAGAAKQAVAIELLPDGFTIK